MNLIDRLPRNSHYVEALAMDEELALEALRRPQPDAAPRRRMSEWSAEVELLSVAVDRIAELTQALAAAHGAKPRQIDPQPRPETAQQKVRHLERQRKHKALVARILPRNSHELFRTGGARPPR